MGVYSALTRAFSDMKLDAMDAAAQELAFTYARALDEGADPAKVGPALLNALEALGMTPRARKAVVVEPEKAVSPLDELRKRREERAANATG